MTTERICQVSNSMRYRIPHDSPTPRWEQLLEGEWKKSHIPSVYGQNPIPVKEMSDEEKGYWKKLSRHGNDGISEIGKKMIAMSQGLRDRHKELVVYDTKLKELEEFLGENLPWSLEWDIDDNYHDYALEALGNNLPDNTEALIRSIMATMPFLTGIGNHTAVFNDGFYCVSNIDMAYDVTTADDVRRGILLATGTYSRPLMRTITEELRHSIDVAEKATLLKMTRGLPPEYIDDLIKNGFLKQDYSVLEHRGIIMDGNNPVLPDWFVNQPHHRRAGWLGQSIVMVSECIQLTRYEDLDISSIDFSHKDINKIHTHIVDAMVSQGSNYFGEVVDEEEKSIDITVDGEPITIQTVTTAEGLEKCGKAMDICVSSQVYANRLSSGMSKFLLGHRHGIPHLFVEYSPNVSSIVEIAGVHNRTATDIERNAFQQVISRQLV